MKMTASDTFKTFIVLIDRLRMRKRHFLTKMREFPPSALTENALFFVEIYLNDLDTNLVQESIYFQCHLPSERGLVNQILVH